MLVKFELEDRHGNFLSENRLEKVMTQEEINLMFMTNEIFYPLGNGHGTFCQIVHTIFEMVQEPQFIEVHLKENDI